MDTIGQWTQWVPIEGADRKYDVLSILDTITTLQVHLFDNWSLADEILMTFDSVYFYAHTDETYKLKLMDELSAHPSINCPPKWTFFKITHSLCLEWISKESYKASNQLSLQHFCFIAGDSLLDIICVNDPKVELIKATGK